MSNCLSSYYTCMYVYMYVRMYVCMYVCMKKAVKYNTHLDKITVILLIKKTLNIHFGSCFFPYKIQKAHFSLHQSPQVIILVRFDSSSHTFIRSAGAGFSFLFPSFNSLCLYTSILTCILQHNIKPGWRSCVLYIACTVHLNSSTNLMFV